MKRGKWLETWDMTPHKFNAVFLKLESNPSELGIENCSQPCDGQF